MFLPLLFPVMREWCSGVLLWSVVWMRQVLQLFLVDCGRAECSLPAATQPLIQTQGRQVTMSVFLWLFKAESRQACLKEKKNLEGAIKQSDVSTCLS